MLRKRLTASLAITALVAGLAVSATPAHAQWRGGYGGWGYHHFRGPPVGPAIVGGALLGLGIGALLAPPPYARPPVVYAPPPPAYYPPPGYAYAPPAYYPAPGYYVR